MDLSVKWVNVLILVLATLAVVSQFGVIKQQGGRNEQLKR